MFVFVEIGWNNINNIINYGFNKPEITSSTKFPLNSFKNQYKIISKLSENLRFKNVQKNYH